MVDLSRGVSRATADYHAGRMPEVAMGRQLAGSRIGIIGYGSIGRYLAPLAKALIAANPERIVWGSDWPHPNSVTLPGKQVADVTPLFQIDDGRLLNQLPVWAPEAAVRKTILVDNPARLYGFG